MTSRKDIYRKFGRLTYTKGASVVRMMEAVLTRPTFNRGIASYVRDFSYSNADEEALFSHLEAAGREDGTWNISRSFGDVLGGWTRRAGFPLVTVTRNWGEEGGGGDRLVLRQKRFVREGGGEEEKGTRWDIPVSYSTAGAGDGDDWEDTAPSLWMTRDEDSVEVVLKNTSTSVPVVVNVQAAGFYRVNYDDTSWQLIAATLDARREAVHPLNRAQIICDVVSLARAGQVSQEVRDGVLAYIGREDHPTPLRAFRECVLFG